MAETRGGHREGSGRKPLSPGEQTITVAIRIPESLVVRLDAMEGKSRSEKILNILRVHVR